MLKNNMYDIFPISIIISEEFDQLENKKNAIEIGNNFCKQIGVNLFSNEVKLSELQNDLMNSLNFTLDKKPVTSIYGYSKAVWFAHMINSFVEDVISDYVGYAIITGRLKCMMVEYFKYRDPYKYGEIFGLV